jgi:hypothetical protein
MSHGRHAGTGERLVSRIRSRNAFLTASARPAMQKKKNWYATG